MNEILLHITTNPQRLFDVTINNQLTHKKVDGSTVAKLLQSQSGEILVESFAKTIEGNSILHTDKQVFKISNTPQTPSPTPTTIETKKEMSDNNATLLKLAIAENQNGLLQSNLERLDKEVRDLRTENHQLRTQNTDLTIKVNTADKEKELAVKHSELSAAPKGLGALASPDMVDKLMDGIGKIIGAYKGNSSESNNNNARIEGLNDIQNEALDVIQSQLKTLDTDKVQQLTFIVKTLVEHNKITDVFTQWTTPKTS